MMAQSFGSPRTDRMGGGEAEKGDGVAVAILDRIAYLGADRGLVAEIMIAGNELVPASVLRGPADHDAKAQRLHRFERGRHRRLRRFGVGSEDNRLALGCRAPARRQGD